MTASRLDGWWECRECTSWVPPGHVHARECARPLPPPQQEIVDPESAGEPTGASDAAAECPYGYSLCSVDTCCGFVGCPNTDRCLASSEPSSDPSGEPTGASGDDEPAILDQFITPRLVRVVAAWLRGREPVPDLPRDGTAKATAKRQGTIPATSPQQQQPTHQQPELPSGDSGCDYWVLDPLDGAWMRVRPAGMYFTDTKPAIASIRSCPECGCGWKPRPYADSIIADYCPHRCPTRVATVSTPIHPYPTGE
jgi:hypothetical protein